jgi:hypothetical protein
LNPTLPICWKKVNFELSGSALPTFETQPRHTSCAGLFLIIFVTAQVGLRHDARLAVIGVELLGT